MQPIFGGNPNAPANDPNNIGHLHDNGNTWGHAAKIDLGNHTTGRLTLQPGCYVTRNISAYPSIIANKNNAVISGSFLNTDPTLCPTNRSYITLTSDRAGTTPVTQGYAQGSINLLENTYFNLYGASKDDYPFTLPTILSTAIWYFAIPFDMDITQNVYFSFGWMGDIITVDSSGNIKSDATKLGTDGITPLSQTTNFRATWQWYIPGYTILPPAVIFDGYNPTMSLNGIHAPNSSTRGQVATISVVSAPYKLNINDSSSNTPSYVGLTGLSNTTNATMIGIQIDVLNSGFITFPATGIQSGHVKFYQGNLIYFSKTMGSTITSFTTF